MRAWAAPPRLDSLDAPLVERLALSAMFPELLSAHAGACRPLSPSAARLCASLGRWQPALRLHRLICMAGVRNRAPRAASWAAAGRPLFLRAQARRTQLLTLVSLLICALQHRESSPQAPPAMADKKGLLSSKVMGLKFMQRAVEKRKREEAAEDTERQRDEVRNEGGTAWHACMLRAWPRLVAQGAVRAGWVGCKRLCLPVASAHSKVADPWTASGPAPGRPRSGSLRLRPPPPLPPRPAALWPAQAQWVVEGAQTRCVVIAEADPCSSSVG